jgi:phage protein D
VTIAGLRYWEPKIDIQVVRGIPAQVTPSINERIISFELDDDHSRDDKATLVLDNSDGKILDPGSLPFGIVMNVSFGYQGALTPPRVLQVRKAKGALRVGGVGPESGSHTASGGQITFDMRSRVWDMNVFRRLSSEEREDRQVLFVNTTRSDIVRTIARRHGYDGPSLLVEDLADEQVLEREVIPSTMTDAEYIADAARTRGWTFSVDVEGFHFHSPRRRQAEDSIEELAWFAGDPDVINWEIEGDLNVEGLLAASGGSRREQPNVEVATAEHEAGRRGLVAVQGSRRGRRDIQLAVPQPNSRQIEAIERSLSRSIDRFKLKLKLVGNPRVLARRHVKLRNFGPMVDGRWYVKIAKHSIRPSQVYITEIEASRQQPQSGGRRTVEVAVAEHEAGRRGLVSVNTSE